LRNCLPNRAKTSPPSRLGFYCTDVMIGAFCFQAADEPGLQTPRSVPQYGRAALSADIPTCRFGI
jgi:hypothetical protein